MQEILFKNQTFFNTIVSHTIAWAHLDKHDTYWIMCMRNAQNIQHCQPVMMWVHPIYFINKYFMYWTNAEIAIYVAGIFSGPTCGIVLCILYNRIGGEEEQVMNFRHRTHHPLVSRQPHKCLLCTHYIYLRIYLVYFIWVVYFMTSWILMICNVKWINNLEEIYSTPIYISIHYALYMHRSTI